MDIVIVLVVAATAMVRPGLEDERGPLAWAAVLLPALILLARRRYPLAVLAATVVCFWVVALTATATLLSPIPAAFAAYAVAIAGPRRTTIIATLAACAAMVLPVWIADADFALFAMFQLTATLAFAAALGDAVRTRRAYIEAITARAERAERTREAEASRRVAEDRLRVARDLHDAVAHQIAVISLNAGVATSALDDRPEVAREALVTIRTASRKVLGEIGELLASLRQGEPDNDAARPGLDDVASLIERFRDAGLTVQLRGDDLLTRAEPVGDVVYAVLQEALTNAHKHGASGVTRIDVSATDDSLEIVAVNPVRGDSASTVSTGLGLVGMRERVEDIGGRLEAGHAGDAYRLRVTLPLQRSRS
ncbi:two-component sensor histidine kinase [Microbacterium thalassium]|nr:two-component sensor histidine kinase [Microbacterium thalassium]